MNYFHKKHISKSVLVSTTGQNVLPHFFAPTPTTIWYSHECWVRWLHYFRPDICYKWWWSTYSLLKRINVLKCLSNMNVEQCHHKACYAAFSYTCTTCLEIFQLISHFAKWWPHLQTRPDFLFSCKCNFKENSNKMTCWTCYTFIALPYAVMEITMI